MLCHIAFNFLGVLHMEILLEKSIHESTAVNTEDAVPRLGDVVSSLAIAAAPLVLDISSETVGERFVLAFCGLLGSSIALFTDKPTSIRDVAARVGSGVFTCQLFGPYLARKIGFTDADARIAVYGIIGLLAWYLMGSLMRLLKQVQDSNLAEKLLRMKFSIPKLEEMDNKIKENTKDIAVSKDSIEKKQDI